MKKKLLAAVCLILIFSLLTGCTTFNNFKNAFFGTDSTETVATDRTIKIGVFEPLSGENREQGNLELMGIQLANELYPEVLGKQVELIIADNQSDIYVAETVAQELVSQNPQVVLGSYGETLTLIAGEAVKANNIPGIAITSTNPLITVNNQYYFCATYAESKQGDALADFVYAQQGKTKAATVKLTGDDTVTANINKFKRMMEKLSGDSECIVGSFELPTESSDYSEVIESLKTSGAEAVFLDVSTTVAQTFLQQAEEAGLTDILFVGPKSWNDENFLSFIESSGAFDIGYAADFSSVTTSTEMSEKFITAYKERYGEDAEPDQETAVAFDAYLMAISAIEDAYNDTMSYDEEEYAATAATEAEGRALREDWQQTQKTGIPTGKAIRDAIKRIEGFEGASGIISYGGTNEAVKSIEVVYYSKGALNDSFAVEAEVLEEQD